MEVLRSLGFGPKQSNEVAASTFLALLDLAPNSPWSAASTPLRGITPIIEFIAESTPAAVIVFDALADRFE